MSAVLPEQSLEVDHPEADTEPQAIPFPSRRPRFGREHAVWLGPLGPWIWFAVRDIHPWLDYVAILLPLLLMAAGLVVGYLAVTRGSLVLAATFVSLALFFVAAVVSPWRPTSAETIAPDFRIASMNLGSYWFSDNDAGFFVFDRRPDILVGTELSESHHDEFTSRFAHSVSDVISREEQEANADALVAVGDDYRRFGYPSMGVYSNHPIIRLPDPIEDEIAGGLPGFRLLVEAPGGDIVLYALHVPRPGRGTGAYEVTITQQARMIDAIAAAIERESDPVVVMGDLNIVDRSSTYRTLTASLRDGMRASGWALPTADRGLPYSLLFLRIDHLLVSEDLCTANSTALDTRFSDHRPIHADIGPCQSADPAAGTNTDDG